jgi:hypothetical protein
MNGANKRGGVRGSAHPRIGPIETRRNDAALAHFLDCFAQFAVAMMWWDGRRAR